MNENEIRINYKNIAVTLSLIIIGIMAGTKEHMPAIPAISFPQIEIALHLGFGIVVGMVIFVAWLVFMLVGSCGRMGMR